MLFSISKGLFKKLLAAKTLLEGKIEFLATVQLAAIQAPFPITTGPADNLPLEYEPFSEV